MQQQSIKQNLSLQINLPLGVTHRFTRCSSSWPLSPLPRHVSSVCLLFAPRGLTCEQDMSAMRKHLINLVTSRKCLYTPRHRPIAHQCNREMASALSCPYCQQPYFTIKGLNTHQVRDHGAFECHLCGQIFPDAGALRSVGCFPSI
jgi:hypothetical protein